MKKHWKTLISCILSLLFVTSCAGETPDETSGGGNSPTEASEEPTTPGSQDFATDPSAGSVTEAPATNPSAGEETGGNTGEKPTAEQLKEFAGKVIAAFGSAPDPWSFLPEGMQPEAHTLSGTAPDYSTATAVASLPKNAIGKQMHAIYGTLNRAEAAFGYVNQLYGGMSAIATIYQSYINKNPEQYAAFEGVWNAFAFRITVSDNEYLLLAKASGVCVELRHSISGKITTGRIDCGDTLTVKYQAGETGLSFAVNAGGIYVSSLEFLRTESGITGYIYETVGSGSARVSSSAIVTVTKKYVIAVGNKGDFAAPGMGVNVEVYNSQTGILLGTEVYETVKLTDYDTLWYRLCDITGIETVSAVFGTDINTAGKNPDSVYINGSETVFAVVYNSVLGIKTSRQFDIEFKTMYVYRYNEEKQSYEEQEIKVPMLFVQRNALDSYLSDIKKENRLPTTPKNLTTDADNAVIAKAYLLYKDAYLTMKDALTPEAILASLGEKNAWFASVTPPAGGVEKEQ